LRTPCAALAGSDLRAKSEMTCPSVKPCCRANCFAVETRSSSSSRVVRIILIKASRIKPDDA
jgi:hypothetical protein